MGFLETFAILFVVVWVVCAFDLLGGDESPGRPPSEDEDEYDSQIWVCPSCGVAIDPTSETCPWCGWIFFSTDGDTTSEDVDSEEVGFQAREGGVAELAPGTEEPEHNLEFRAQTDPPPNSRATLAEAVRAILAEGSIGGGRERLIRSLVGKDHAFELTVKRVERTIGRYSDPDYRNGRTVSGTIGATGIEVSVFFPAVLNDRIDPVEPGSSLPIRGVFSDWDSLRRRPTIRAKEA